MAANYRSACRAKSTADFIAKLAIVEEEADETLFWLELIKEMKILKDSFILPLMKENDEIIAIMVSSIKKTRMNMQNKISCKKEPKIRNQNSKCEKDCKSKI